MYIIGKSKLGEHSTKRFRKNSSRGKFCLYSIHFFYALYENASQLSMLRPLIYSDDAYNSLYQLIEDVRFPTIATAIISIIT